MVLEETELQRTQLRTKPCQNLIYDSTSNFNGCYLSFDEDSLVNGFDLSHVLEETLHTVMNRLALPPIPLVVCTNSYSLYDCLVKLGTTTEKRLIINLMALRQSYERREISEIRWINGEDNPADAITKSSANRALEGLVSSNSLTVRLEAWVERKAFADL